MIIISSGVCHSHWITGLSIKSLEDIDNPVNPAHMSSSSSQESFTMGLMTIIGPVVDTVDTSVKEVFDSQVGCVCLRWKRRMWCGIFQNTMPEHCLQHSLTRKLLSRHSFSMTSGERIVFRRRHLSIRLEHQLRST